MPPVTRRTAAGHARPDVKRSVYYEFDKEDVKPEYRTLLKRHARWLQRQSAGAPDDRRQRRRAAAAASTTCALGQRRAESVTKLMMLMGVRGEQIEAISCGEERPRSDGHDEKSWSENRRSAFARRW